MLKVLPNGELFRHSIDPNLRSYVELSQEAHRTMNVGSAVMLDAEIARIADDLYFRSIHMRNNEPQKIAMAKFLARQKAVVPIPARYMGFSGPLHVSDVAHYLDKWGFNSEGIDVHMKKRRRRFSNRCEFVITFSER